MKVTELLGEARSYYGADAVKTDLASRKSDKGEKTGKLAGGTDDWLDAMNKQMKTPITKDHVAAVRKDIEASPEYKHMKDIGFTDVSSAIAKKNGTYMFTDGNQTFNFLVTGKINNRSQYGGGQRASTLPRIVPSDPMATLQKTMTRSLAHFASKKVKEPRGERLFGGGYSSPGKGTVKPVPKK